jgi:membrane protein
MPPEMPTRTRREKLRQAKAGTWDFLAEVYNEWSKDNAMTLGAALAFYTTFSMAPLLIIIVAIFGILIGQDIVQTEILKRAQELIGQQGANAVRVMLHAAYKPGAGFVATVIGLGVIVLGSTSAMVMLKQGLNIVWGATEDWEIPIWTLIKERLLSFLMILFIGILMSLSMLASVVLTFLSTFFQYLLPFAPFFLQVSDFIISIVLITLLFALIYKVLPDVTIAWADVWIGSAITAFLFTLGKFVFGIYLGHSSITSAYGAASSLVIIMMWVYYSAQVFFIGAEITQVYSNRYGSRVTPRRVPRDL